MLDRISLWSHLVLGFCLLEDFKLYFQSHYLWLVCLYFLFLSSSVLESCFVHFFQVIQYSRYDLCISAVSVVISSFSFLILSIWILSFFSWFWLMVYKFYLLKEPSFSFIFDIIFFFSISFISALIFMISFLLLTLGFVCCSFSSCFRCQVRLFDIFLVSWGKIVLL